jgi:hypothetical protein
MSAPVSEASSVSSAVVSYLNEAMDYRSVRATASGAAPSRVGEAGAVRAVENYLSGAVPERGTVTPEMINRMVF